MPDFYTANMFASGRLVSGTRIPVSPVSLGGIGEEYRLSCATFEDCCKHGHLPLQWNIRFRLNVGFAHPPTIGECPGAPILVGGATIETALGGGTFLDTQTTPTTPLAITNWAGQGRTGVQFTAAMDMAGVVIGRAGDLEFTFGGGVTIEFGLFEREHGGIFYAPLTAEFGGTVHDNGEPAATAGVAQAGPDGICFTEDDEYFEAADVIEPVGPDGITVSGTPSVRFRHTSATSPVYATVAGDVATASYWDVTAEIDCWPSHVQPWPPA